MNAPDILTIEDDTYQVLCDRLILRLGDVAELVFVGRNLTNSGFAVGWVAVDSTGEPCNVGRSTTHATFKDAHKRYLAAVDFDDDDHWGSDETASREKRD